MLLPNGLRAIASVAKLANYCLDPNHPRGRHKARASAAGLGLTREHAFLLRSTLLEAAAVADTVVLGAVDGFGARYVLDLILSGPKGMALLRSVWIVKTHEDFPRFVTCFPL
ncbi:MAG TPA: hypothetical protein VGK73_26245 [Polyangiaceae bacterium]